MMPESEIKIEYLLMDIKRIWNDVFRVAKLRRISSPPVRASAVRDAKTSVLDCLVDIFRCGTESRAYRDFVKAKQDRQVFGPLDAESEWAAYNAEICRAKGMERIEPFRLGRPRWTAELPPSRFAVKYRKGTMNGKPYLIACVGKIMASPAAIWVTYPHARESALARLYDVFRIGTQGQVYKDLAEGAAKSRRSPETLLCEWQDCKRAVLWEVDYSRHPDRAPEEVRAEWEKCAKEVAKESERAENLARRLDIGRQEGA